ncbi:creatininase family protein [Spiractinospora alimapuensis]|uniref:creatininase family protein n=1 Tax=Spiractinospora alimapuensis TaxID=2820884 RepID=UPI001F171DA8|nr:creatininase family protein [Spiractinospora alimapuensis]QVQ52774.1 creatininase family protein [Spiractinospora alimapuensis]
MTVRHLTELTAAELREAAPSSIAVLPIGSQEQHGGHLPMGTDLMMAETVVDRSLARLEDQEPDLVRLPALPYGYSPHHAFAAAVTLTSATLVSLLGEVIESLVDIGFRRVIVVNGHGGNDEAMRVAVKGAALRRDIAVAACNYWDIRADAGQDTPDGAEESRTPGHAGWFETSLMLAATPERVGPPRWSPPEGPPPLFDRPPYPGLAVERHGEWERVGGVTDDPATASADVGHRLLTQRVDGLVGAIVAFDRATRASHGVGDVATGPSDARGRKGTP